MKRIPSPLLFFAMLEALVAPTFIFHLAESQNAKLISSAIHISLPILLTISILKFSRWSIPAILSLSCLSTLGHCYELLLHPSQQVSILVAILLILDLSVLRYFSLSEIREIYESTDLHWWKTKRRFQLNIRGVLHSSQGEFPVEIKNISEGGIFLLVPLDAPKEKLLKISFLKLNGVQLKIIRHTSSAEGSRYRTQFQKLTFEQTEALQQLLFALRINSKSPWQEHLEDFKSWMLQSAIRRSSWVPQIQNKKSA